MFALNKRPSGVNMFHVLLWPSVQPFKLFKNKSDNKDDLYQIVDSNHMKIIKRQQFVTVAVEISLTVPKF